MAKCLKWLWTDEEGWTKMELAILVDLIAVAALMAWTAYGATAGIIH